MKRSLLAFSIVMFAVSSAHATNYDLYDLLNGASVDADNGGSDAGNSFAVDNETFTITLATLHTTGFTSPVQPLAEGDFEISTTPGIAGFEITTGADAYTLGPGSNTLDLALGYNVTAASPIIEDLEGSVAGVCTSNGLSNCSLTVVENAFAIGTTDPSILSDGGFTFGTDPGLSLSGGSTIIPPVASMSVTKDIHLLAAAGVGGTADANFSIVSQYTSQTVPEPGFYGLLALGFSGLVWFSRKRKTA